MSPIFQNPQAVVFNVSMNANFNHVPNGLLTSTPGETIDFILDPSQVSSGTLPTCCPTSVPDLVGANGVVINGITAECSGLPDSPHQWRMDATVNVASVDALDQATLFKERIIPAHTPTPGQLFIDFSTATFTLVKGANLSWNAGTLNLSSVASKVYVCQVFFQGRLQ